MQNGTISQLGKEIGMRSRFYVMFAVVLLLLGAGCQRSSDGTLPVNPAGSETTEQFDLNSPTGGFSSMDEDPAFGEPDEFASLMEETAVEDSCEYHHRDRLQRAGVRLFQFRAVWGYLADMCDSAAADPCPLDWSGSLHFEGGIILMKNTISFEPEDAISRVDSSTISWVSRTGPGVDGIHVQLALLPPLDSLITPQLELSTGPYSRTFTLAELVALHLVEPVDSCGNAISIASVLTAVRCPHGHLMGSWKKIAPDTLTSEDSTNVDGIVLGVFRGVWIGEHGRIGGYLKGIYGLNGSDEPVFFGKYIDTAGHFKGILRGEFGSRPSVSNACDRDRVRCERRPRGWFAGEWIDDRVNVQGKLRGHWIADEDGKGLFHGVWGMRCSENL